LVSVVILNWNGADYLGKCLDSVLQQTYDNYEVIVVDNHSTDDSTEIIRTRYPSVRLITLPSNVGFAKGNNIGFTASKGNYVIALNNDTEVQPNFIEVLLSVAEKDGSIGSVGCRIVQYDGSTRYGPVYSAHGGLVLGRPIAILSRNHFMEVLSRRPAQVLANCGCAVLYRKKVLEKVGGFDPLYFSNWEDHDLGIRMNIAGYPSMYTPTTTVLHLGGRSEGSPGSSSRLALVVQGMMMAYYKNFAFRNATKNVLIAVMMVGGSALYEWHQGKVRMLTPIPALAGLLKGISRFILSFRSVHVHRLEVQKLRRLSDKEVRIRTDIKRVW
jgi:GT2 family glycosyltransferase